MRKETIQMVVVNAGVAVLIAFLVGTLTWDRLFRRDMAKWGAACVERWNRLPPSPPMTEHERRAARLAFLNKALADTNRELESLRRPNLFLRLISDGMDEQWRIEKIAQCEGIRATALVEIRKLRDAESLPPPSPLMSLPAPD